MQYTRIEDCKDYDGQTIHVRGWLYNMRSSGSIAFLQVRDGSGFIQAVASKDDLSPEVWERIETVGQESSITMSGIVKKHPKKDEVYELQVTDFSVLQNVEDYPIAKKEHGPSFLLDNRHLWLRSKKQWAIQRIRHTVIKAIYDYFDKEGFTKIDSPILTPNSCEDSTELFDIDYFGERKAYLSQTGQLYLEAGIMAHGNVFDFGPVFRAEKSKTRRHLTEFWMMDAEMAFYDYKDNMRVQEELICYIVQTVLDRNRGELEILERDISALEKVKAPFIYMTHKEAVKELQSLGSDIKEDDDLGADDETMLTKQYDKPLFITQYPKAVKAFYMKEDPEDSARVLCSDLLAPEGYGEISGGSEREIDYDKLLKRLEDNGLCKDDYDWYLDLRKYGSVPHSGFGFGLERIVTWISGIEHIRETIPFPRMINRITP